MSNNLCSVKAMGVVLYSDGDSYNAIESKENVQKVRAGCLFDAAPVRPIGLHS